MAAKKRRSRSSPESLPVLIRYDGRGRPTRPDWHVQDLVAIFPTEPGTSDPSTMTCYVVVGQHATCSWDYVRRTKPATAEQVEAMLRELRGVGYKHLKVVKRMTSQHDAARLAALRR